jgi:hypothetical protein
MILLMTSSMMRKYKEGQEEGNPGGNNMSNLKQH